ncbi:MULTISPECIES: NADH-quinone oxidoreductase subunit M [unclassified Campylobacter]|uniref:NADH-quinone oxidoreductase subunit M n=1 Tax=unclassified Campylobacter TaxID=2593542 RepID=UPI001237E301|nr:MULTISPECIES: NADH-quinone oxidoreductase subunit M [unclassified Campylobacter]KAA6227267.1 NADH-quinone oxidoreductase subunit M [Campylobacter sp. LR286c]KAA6227860.1 NADH-quinone oxidoreductase subunit M [Campylobacter sp. LR185c]KAA6228268.1 NADH-quinone oxidoreductase subunit M [Campylobacter sp. LR196d]KAA6229268.1 NADH-quinone oxidoreductase subunit M [Campylobacter sp. LR291e]KAA6231074.1 NADH-quinone oxidoreductase subunit M [Campylobacter sp. LR264d]
MLNYLIFFPLIVAFVVLCLNRGGVKFFSVLASLMILGLNLKIFYDYLVFENSFEFKLPFKLLNFFSYHIGVDSIALSLMILCSLMIFLAFIFLKVEQKSMVAAIFFLEFAIMGLFSSLDALLFYIFWEFSLLPLIFIIGVYGKEYIIGLKFFIYAFAGSILMLVSMVYLAYLNYQLLGIWTFDIEIWKNNVSAASFTQQLILFCAFFFAFAIKAPLFPVHTWAPKVYANSPILVSVMLVAFKMSPFGFLRFCLPLFPDASVYFLPMIASFCILSILYTAFIAFKADDLRELIAYSSISHLGIMVLGIFSFNTIGISGSIFYMFAHGIVTAALFLLAQSLYERYNTTSLDKLHSLAQKAPLFTLFFAIMSFASISLPITINFVGEFLVLLGIAKLHIIYGLFAGLIVILGAIYMLYVLRKICFMQEKSSLINFSLHSREIIALIPMVCLVFYLGISPKVLLYPIEKDVDKILEVMNIRAVEQDTINFLHALGASK